MGVGGGGGGSELNILFCVLKSKTFCMYLKFCLFKKDYQNILLHRTKQIDSICLIPTKQTNPTTTSDKQVGRQPKNDKTKTNNETEENK